MDRRRALRAAGLAGLAATAGCLAGARDVLTSVPTPDPGAPTYRRWLPAPAALGVERYDVSHLSLAGLRDAALPPGFDHRTRNAFARQGRDHLGLDGGCVDRVVGLDRTRATVVLGAFDAAAVGDVLAATGYAAAGDHAGFARYTREDDPRAAAVADGAAVLSRADAPGRAVRAVVDARRGAAERYHEASADAARLSAALGGPTLAWLRFYEPGQADGPLRLPGSTATGTTRQFVGDRVVTRRVVRFADDPVPTRRLRAWATRASRFAPLGGAGLDVAVRGDLGVVESSVAVERFAGERTPLVPVVTWGFEAGDGRVTVRHEGGDPVRADRLVLRAAGGLAGSQFADRYDTVRAGDAVGVDAAALRVVWRAGRTRSVLATHGRPGG